MKLRMILSIGCGILLASVSCFASKVHQRGYWVGADSCVHHFFDTGLAPALGEFFQAEMSTSLVDFGCGMGDYVKHFRTLDLKCDGFDGNPNTPQLTQSIAQVKDLSKPFDLKKQYDWVLSLEIGEHIPKKYETIFIENLVRHARYGIVLSWALKGQGGYGHFNEQDNDYIKEKMASYGFYCDSDAEQYLRKAAKAGWLKNTVMVFRRMS